MVSPSRYQEEIFRSSGNIIVEAMPGSGKSWTLEQLCGILHGSKVLLAFNRDIVKELKSRGLPARTYNSLGYSILKDSFTIETDLDKLEDITSSVVPREILRRVGNKICKLVRLAYAAGCVPFHKDFVKAYEKGWIEWSDKALWEELIYDHDINLDGMNAENVIRLCEEIMLMSLLDTSRMSFDDQILMPVLYDLPCRKYKNVLLDEAQDTNKIQCVLLGKIIDSGGRLIAVGDPNQSLYFFRGASANAMNNIKEMYDCKTYPLSICYRCDKKIVEEASSYVPEIEHDATKPDGLVETIDEYDYNLFNPKDLVICRNNGPLVRMAMYLISNGKSCAMLGREIGNKLKSTIEKANISKNNSGNFLYDFSEALLRMREKECLFVSEKFGLSSEKRIEAIYDKYDCIDSVMKKVSEIGEFSVDGVLAEIDKLFIEESSNRKVILSTIHKIKGGEADRVFWLDSWLSTRIKGIDDPVKLDRIKHEEKCLRFVATTRARHELYYIDSSMMGKA